MPDTPRSLQDEFVAAVAAWRWDVALLQEVPPWWTAPLGEAAGASARMALTSRNLLLPLRRAVASRRPDIIKSNGGGANVILARGTTIAEHRVHSLRRWPERRVVHGVRLASGVWVSNVHAQVHSDERARADLRLAAERTVAWADGSPAILGGDANVPTPALEGFRYGGGHGVDHVLARGLTPRGAAVVLDREGLSDHAPVIIDLI